MNSMNPSDVLALASDLPSLPEVYFQVDKVLQDPTFTLEQLADVIERDPGISARLLRLANSALYGFPARIETIQRAVTMIGASEIKYMVLATAVMSTFRNMPVGMVSMRSFWEHSIACGVAAKHIASYRREANVDRFYTVGLLHDVGRLLMHMAVPEQMSDLLFRHRQGEGHLTDLELASLGVTHADVGAALLERWNLPTTLSDAVRNHHVLGAEPECSIEVAVVHVADLLVNAMSMGSSGTRLVPELNDHAWERVGLEVSDISSLSESTAETFGDVAAIFLA